MDVDGTYIQPVTGLGVLAEPLLADVLRSLPRASLHSARLASRAIDAAARGGVTAVVLTPRRAAEATSGGRWLRWSRFPELQVGFCVCAEMLHKQAAGIANKWWWDSA